MSTYFRPQLTWFIRVGRFGYINGEWSAVSEDQKTIYEQGAQIIFAEHDSADAYWQYKLRELDVRQELQTPQGKFTPTEGSLDYL